MLNKDLLRGHTKGPWHQDGRTIHGEPRYGKLEEVEAGAPFEGCSVNELYEVCTMNRLHVYPYSQGYKDYPAREDVKERVRKIADGNAALIAAAPTLLAEHDVLCDLVEAQSKVIEALEYVVDIREIKDGGAYDDARNKITTLRGRLSL